MTKIINKNRNNKFKQKLKKIIAVCCQMKNINRHQLVSLNKLLKIKINKYNN